MSCNANTHRLKHLSSDSKPLHYELQHFKYTLKKTACTETQHFNHGTQRILIFSYHLSAWKHQISISLDHIVLKCLILKFLFDELEEGSVIKSIFFLLQRTWVQSQAHDSSQSSITPFPGTLTPISDI